MNEVVYYGIRAWLIAKEICCCNRKKRQFDVVVPKLPETCWKYGNDFDIQTLIYANGITKRIVHPASSVSSHKDRPSIGFTPPCPSPPWFFIGCYDSARSLQDKTCEMDEYIYPGNKITPQLLQHLFPGSQRWVYIHPRTFDETEFPSDGIVIEKEEDGCSR
jgi:hypothetical protein